ncbi:MAG: hypothetical protein GY832_16485, partial [Chloroflexi bacterium]|nr:hypothetical protein [Chloroflexota bacterium]
MDAVIKRLEEAKNEVRLIQADLEALDLVSIGDTLDVAYRALSNARRFTMGARA